MRKYAESIRDGLLNYESKKASGFSAKIQRSLKGAPEIKKVELASIRPFEISIEVSEDQLRQYGLSLSDVAAAVRGTSLDLPSGSVKTSSGEIVVRAVGKRYRGEDFQNIIVRTLPDGSGIRLDQVAEVIDGFEAV